MSDQENHSDHLTLSQDSFLGGSTPQNIHSNKNRICKICNKNKITKAADKCRDCYLLESTSKEEPCKKCGKFNHKKRKYCKEFCNDCYRENRNLQNREKYGEFRICTICNSKYENVNRKYCFKCYDTKIRIGLNNAKCEVCNITCSKKPNKRALCRKCYTKEYQKLHHQKIALNAKKKNRIKKGQSLDLNEKLKGRLSKRSCGEGWINGNGYAMLYRPDHPNALKNGQICEHAYLMSNHLGRALKKNENIHHINGIRDDNRIENLELWSKAQPAGQRVEDKIKWAKEFLEEYGYTVIK